jgi:hypothetical protein
LRALPASLNNAAAGERIGRRATYSESPSRLCKKAAGDFVALSYFDEFDVAAMQQIKTGNRNLDRFRNIPAHGRIQFRIFGHGGTMEFADVA